MIHKCFRILFLQGFFIHPSYKKKGKKISELILPSDLILLAYTSSQGFLYSYVVLDHLLDF
jgi:hypothetical protein